MTLASARPGEQRNDSKANRGQRADHQHEGGAAWSGRPRAGVARLREAVDRPRYSQAGDQLSLAPGTAAGLSGTPTADGRELRAERTASEGHDGLLRRNWIMGVLGRVGVTLRGLSHTRVPLSSAEGAPLLGPQTPPACSEHTPPSHRSGG